MMCHIAKHKSEHLCHAGAFYAAQITQLHKFSNGPIEALIINYLLEGSDCREALWKLIRMNLIIFSRLNRFGITVSIEGCITSGKILSQTYFSIKT